MTATDIAVAGGWADIGDTAETQGVGKDVIVAARAEMKRLIETNVERMKTEARDLPLLVVGGGSILVDWEVASASEVLRPAYSSVANAVGAAIAQVAGEVERVVAINEVNRESILEEAKSEARENAARAGATEASIEVIEVEQIPISYRYLPGNPSRLRVKAVGDLPV